MDADYFNLSALNLVIGLTRGNRWLSPLSDKFVRLGYRLFQIEPRLLIAGGTRSPDCVLTSEGVGHSVLGEWTTRELDEAKRQQLMAYSGVTGRDLITQLGVSRTAGAATGVWLIVPRELVRDYQALVTSAHADALMSVLECQEGSGCTLEEEGGTTRSPDLDKALAGRTQLRRIPRGYCRVCLSNLSWQRLAEHAVHALVDLARHGVVEFDLESVCRRMIDVWDQLSTDTQVPVARNVRKVLRQMTQTQYLGRWLKRTQETQPRYSLDERVVMEPLPMLGAFERALDRFLAEIAGEPMQLPLPELDPAEPGSGHKP